jgi:hypothetical protein
MYYVLEASARISRVGQNSVYFTVYDCKYGDVPAKNTSCGQP